MLKTKCQRCEKPFVENQPTDIMRSETVHLRETGHRTYIGIIGMKTHTLALPGEPKYEVAAQAVRDGQSSKLPKVVHVEENNPQYRLDNHSDRIQKLEEQVKHLQVMEGFYNDFQALLSRYAIPPEAPQAPIQAPNEPQPDPAPPVTRLDRVGLFTSSFVTRFPKAPLALAQLDIVRGWLSMSLFMGDIQQGDRWTKSPYVGQGLTQLQACKALEYLYQAGEIKTFTRGRRTLLVLRVLEDVQQG